MSQIDASDQFFHGSRNTGIGCCLRTHPAALQFNRHMFLLMAPVKLSMKVSDGVNAVDGGVQMLGDLGRGVAGLQVQKARHDRQVVFDPMVEFVQQRGLMGLRTFERCDVYVEVREASG